jgi:hypothetical protein
MIVQFEGATPEGHVGDMMGVEAAPSSMVAAEADRGASTPMTMRTAETKKRRAMLEICRRSP